MDPGVVDQYQGAKDSRGRAGVQVADATAPGLTQVKIPRARGSHNGLSPIGVQAPMTRYLEGDRLLTRAGKIARGVAPNDEFGQGLALALRRNWLALFKDSRHDRHPKAEDGLAVARARWCAHRQPP